jgi:bifunctional non-homologous end joining protein LigD
VVDDQTPRSVCLDRRYHCSAAEIGGEQAASRRNCTRQRRQCGTRSYWRSGSYDKPAKDNFQTCEASAFNSSSQAASIDYPEHLGRFVRVKNSEEPPLRMSDRIPFRVKPMLATLVSQPFDRRGWIYEEKYDGIRILAYKEGKEVRLLSRNDIDRTKGFPEIVDAIRALKPTTLLLDGELVVFDRKKVSRFQLLQQGKGEAVYAVFDCLYQKGKDLRRQPLSERRTAMENSLGKPGVLIPSRRLAANGLEAYRDAKKRNYEGLVAKDASSPYFEGRSTNWLKVKVHQEDEFVIGGFTKPAGARKHFGALLLGAYQSGKLHYVGKVGTGFDEDLLGSLAKKFKPLEIARPPFVDPPRERDVTYIQPKLVAQISFQEWTADMKLRQPVFLGLRDDKEPTEVLLPEPQK